MSRRPVSPDERLGTDPRAELTPGQPAGTRTVRDRSGRLTHQLIEAAAVRWPDRPAVLSGGRRLSYAHLLRESAEVRDWLVTLGITVNQPVGVALRRDLALVPALLAIWQAGGCYVPLDSAAPPLRTSRMLEDLSRHGLRYVIVDGEETADRLNLTVASRLALPSGGALIAGGFDPPAAGRHGAPADPPADRIAYIMYTSGSTGRPKGTLVTHPNVVAFLNAIEEAIGGDSAEVALATTALTFDISVLEIFWPLAMGRQLHLLETIVNTDAALWARVFAAPGRKLLQLTPSTADLVDLSAGPYPMRVLVGGESLPGPTALKLLRAGDRVYNMYGPTEATVWCTYHPVSPGDHEQRTVSLGRPLPNCETLVLDQRGRPVPTGEIGELYVHGPQIAAGYLGGGPADSAFRRDIIEGKTVYRTGDLVQLRADGNLYFCGRSDAQVKIAGNRVELEEVESVLREHDSVGSAAVVVDRAGEAPALRAYLQLTGTGTAGTAAHHTRELMQDWLQVFESEFAQMPDVDEEPEPDFSLWRSVFDGAPISKPEMQEWLRAVASLVEGLDVRRVLDIGCGTGDLLYALGRQFDTYVGVDPSPSAIPRLRRAFSRRSDMATFVRAFAHELSNPSVDASISAGIGSKGGPDRPDCVVLNSVIQYFPSLDYLSDVLDYAFERLDDGGTLVIADVRSLPLLTRLLARAGVRGTQPGAGGRPAIMSELCIDPLYFAEWAARQPTSGRTWILPKLMKPRNEIADFRFDVLVTKATPGDPAYDETTYAAVGGTMAGLVDRLSEAAASSRASAVRRIPNARHVTAHDGAAALAPIDIEQAVRHLPGVAVGFDPSSPDDGSLLVAYHPEGRHDWAAFARECQPSGALATNPSISVAAEAIGTELSPFLSARLPAHMIPATIRAVDRLPLTTSGKVDRVALSQSPPPGYDVRRPASPADGATSSEDYEHNEALRVVVDLMSSLLSREIAPDEDFVDAGGTSLDAARLTGKLWERGAWVITPGQVLRARTARALAMQVNEAASAASSDGARAAGSGTRKTDPAATGLSLAQRGILSLAFLDNAANERMNIVARWRFETEIDVDRLRAALRRITKRHPILRAINSPSGIPAPGVDTPILHLPAEEPGSPDGASFDADYAWRPFDLTTEVPVRWALRRPEPDRAEVCAVLHHIAVDDAGLRTLNDDLVAAYADPDDATGDADSGRLAAALISERRLYLQRASADRAYWSRRRADFEDCASLPSVPTEGDPAVCRRLSAFTRDGASHLEALAREARVTAFAFFLAVAGWSIGNALPGAALLAGVPRSSREEVGGDGELGCFANLVPIALDPHRAGATEYLRNTSEALLEGLDHGLLPFSESARAASLPRDRWNNVRVAFACELDHLPEAALVDTTRITVSYDAPYKQLHPVNVRGEIVGPDLAVHIDAESGSMSESTMRRILHQMVSIIEGRAWV